MPARSQQRLSKEQARAFLATPKGRRWLQKKIAEKHANRPDPGPSPVPLITKYPFVATINGKAVIVNEGSVSDILYESLT